MADQAVTTRRAAIVGAFASTATLAIAIAPALDIGAKAAAPALPPAPDDPVKGLVGIQLAGYYAQKLAEAMDSPTFPGKFWSVTVKSGDANQSFFFGLDLMAQQEAARRLA